MTAQDHLRTTGIQIGRRVHRAVSLIFSRIDSIAVFSTITLGYFVVFLWIIGDLSFHPTATFELLVIDDPLGRIGDRTGPFVYERIARLDVFIVRILVSPVNMAIALGLAILVGLNLGLTYLAVVQPAACGLRPGTGVLAAIPALLSGTVCCGPIILIVLGIQASGLLLGLFAWLLPIGIVLLLVSLVFVAGKISQPPAVG